MDEAENIAREKEKFWPKLVGYLKHPVIQLLTGVFVTAAFFYIVERKEIEPRYSVSPIELLAEQLEDNPNLKIYWGDREIQNIKSVQIAIWNSGRQYIDKERISTTNPIGIVVPSGVDILYAEFIETSRPNLSFSTHQSSYDEETEFIQIEVLGDEAIEQNDGGLVKILFTGDPSEEFYVVGRIFGSKRGFKEMDWVVSKGSRIVVYGIYFAVFCYLLLAYLVFKSLYPRYKNQSHSVKKYLFALVIIAVVGFSIYASINLAIGLRNIPLKNPAWLSTQ